MKIVINTCYGGFSLSATAIQQYAFKKGKKCYFFDGGGLNKPYLPITMAVAEESVFNTVFTIPNPNEYLGTVDWAAMTDDEKTQYNKKYDAVCISKYDIDRADPDLVAVVEELGNQANGSYAKLKVVEIPDGIEWELDEYDGIENIQEKTRKWY
jgi:hypothetical protein